MIKVKFDIDEKKYEKSNWIIFFKQQQITLLVAASVVLVAAVILAASFQNFIGLYILAALAAVYLILCVVLHFTVKRSYRTNNMYQRADYFILEFNEETITDTVVFKDSEPQTHTLPLSDIYKVLVTKKCIMIFISSINYFFITGEEYLSGSREELIAFLSSRLPAIKFKFNKKK